MNHILSIDQNPKMLSELRAIFSSYLNDLFTILHHERSRKIPASALQYALALEDRLRRIIDRYFDQLDRLAALCVFPNGEVWSPVTLNILTAAQKILCSAMLADLSLHADDALRADLNLNVITDRICREADASCFFYTNPSAERPAPDLTALDSHEHDPQNRRRWPASAEHDPDGRDKTIASAAENHSCTAVNFCAPVYSPRSIRDVPAPLLCVRFLPFCPIIASSGLSPPPRISETMGVMGGRGRYVSRTPVGCAK